MMRYNQIAVSCYTPLTPVVFLHAFPVNRQMWAPQLSVLRKKKIAWITYDYPGFGETPILSDVSDIYAYGREAIHFLDEVGVEKAVFVGLSMGGYVALSLYRHHPERFAGLVLADTRASADTAEGRENRYRIISQLQQTADPQPLFNGHLEKFFTEETRRNRPDLLAQTRQMMAAASLKGIIAAQKAMAERPDSTALLPQMNFPVLVLVGEQDTLTTVADARQMVDRLPNGQLAIIPDAAHLSNLEQPDQFNEILGEYLSRVLHQT